MVVIIIIIIIYTLFTLHTKKYEDYLTGVWVADAGSDFCKESDIESMMLYIGPPEYNWYGRATRQCYIVIMPGVAESLTLQYTKNWCGPNIGDYILHGLAEFDDNQIWEENVIIETSMMDGNMNIYTMTVDDTDHNKLMYARLYKQHETTDLVKALEP